MSEDARRSRAKAMFEEMGEFAAHFAHYAGFPVATQLYTTFQQIATELDADRAD